MYLRHHPLLNDSSSNNSAQGLFHFYRAIRMLREIKDRRGAIPFVATMMANHALFVGFGADPDLGTPGRNISLTNIDTDLQALCPPDMTYRLP